MDKFWNRANADRVAYPLGLVVCAVIGIAMHNRHIFLMLVVVVSGLRIVYGFVQIGRGPAAPVLPADPAMAKRQQELATFARICGALLLIAGVGSAVADIQGITSGADDSVVTVTTMVIDVYCLVYPDRVANRRLAVEHRRSEHDGK